MFIFAEKVLRHFRISKIQTSQSLFRLCTTLFSEQSHWLPWNYFWNLNSVEQEWKWQEAIPRIPGFFRVWFMLLHAILFVQFWKTARLGKTNWWNSYFKMTHPLGCIFKASVCWKTGQKLILCREQTGNNSFIKQSPIQTRQTYEAIDQKQKMSFFWNIS